MVAGLITACGITGTVVQRTKANRCSYPHIQIRNAALLARLLRQQLIMFEE